MIVPAKGGTFLYRAGPGDLHLHICLTDPFDAENEVPQQVLVVSASTVRGHRGEDLTCLLTAGDHDFIKVDSYIAYSKWRYLTPSLIQKAESQGLAQARQPVSSAIYLKVRSGLFISPRVPPCARDFITSYENPPGRAKGKP